MIKGLIIFLFLFINLYPESAKEEYEKGSLLLSKGKYDEAILAFNASLKKNPYYKEAYNKLGLAYYQKKLYKNAISEFKKAIALDRAYHEVYNNLGLTYEAFGKINEAIKNFRVALKYDPTNYEYRYNLAGSLYKKGLIYDAIDEYEKCIEIEPSFYLPYIKLGDIYWKDKKLKDEAIIFYEEAKAKAEKSPLPHISLGRLYYNTKEIEKAISEYKKAISKDKRNFSAGIELGIIYIENKEYKEPEKIYKGLDNLKKDSIIKYLLGFVYEKQGRYKEALSSYEDSLAIKDSELLQLSKERILLKEPYYFPKRKEESIVAFKSANYYFKKRMIPISIYEHKRAISLDPQALNIRLSLAKIYEDYERLEEALNEIAKVVELEPENIEAKDGIERILFKKKRGFVHQEGIENIPKPDLRLSFFGIVSSELIIPGKLDYLNNLLLSFFSFSKKLTLYPDISNYEKDKAIELAKERGSDFLLFAELKQEKIEAKLIDLENLEEEDIIVKLEENRLKEAIYYLCWKIEQKLPIKARIFEIKKGMAFINAGRLSGIKEKDILNLLEDGKTIAKMKVIKVDPLASCAIVPPPYDEKVLEIGKEVRK